jgi:hypothetical protein
MKAHIKLGRIFGVAIGLHYSWIIIALLVTLSLRAQFAMEHPNWGGSTTWGIAIIMGLLFFAHNSGKDQQCQRKWLVLPKSPAKVRENFRRYGGAKNT